MSANEKSLEGFGHQRCLFLDRDGVIVHDIPYNTDLSKITLKPGIIELLKKAHAQGLWVTIVSNQSGLGRGYFSWTDYRKVHQKICQLLAAQGEWVDLALCAPFYEGTAFTQAKSRPHFRKPEVGMFKHAEEELGVSFPDSLMVGDSATDLIPAFHCGVRKLYLVTSEKQTGEIAKLEEFKKTHTDFQYQLISNFSEISF
ncbi:D-glycero-alpha-D-manno-heptose-1,7-bisphosphate 7-phosphatase [Bdellovibrio sp. HCB337]|uniref:D-glycero-alpha-D-manno-heptose-1,7-bisphosphate 7-phosphatase n=1 Tax=Bdellovibrio sp. HCB337 TaxID=3394358 RepID=UPI0039A45D6D